MRFILFLLILALCFLLGVLYGVEKDLQRETAQPTDEMVEQAEEGKDNEIELLEPVAEEIALAHSEATSSYKVASALQTIVDFFYNIVVEVLYEVSKLFY